MTHLGGRESGRLSCYPVCARWLTVLILLLALAAPSSRVLAQTVDSSADNQPSMSTPEPSAEESAGEYGNVTEAEVGEAAEVPHVADPLERWNRIVFKVNDKLYFWVLKPITRVYKRVVPEDFRLLFKNVYGNASAPIRIVNNILQLRLRYGASELGRFAINTTLGIGGLRNIGGDCFGMKTHDADFGETLGYYGLGQGFFIVWPVLGPSTARDTVGYAGDVALYPPTWFAPTTVSAAASAHNHVNNLSFHLGEYESLKKAAVDPYIAVRSAYVQNRAAAVEEVRSDR